MSRLHLLNEISTVVKMAGEDEVKLYHYLDDLLLNYNIEPKTPTDHEQDTEDYLNLFVTSLMLENYSNVTLTNYQYELRNFLNFVQKPVPAITTSDIRQYLAACNNLKTSTISSKIFVIRSFFSWLVREEIILRNPTLKIRTPKTPKRVREGLTIEELELVREACQTPRERALIEVFYSTGCRLSEIVGLNIRDVNQQDMSAYVIGKGNKERKVYFSFRAMIFLRKYLETRTDDCPALFVTERRPYRRLNQRGVQHAINKIAERANISKKLTPHVLRHTFAMLSMESGMDIADLQHLLGHENPATTTQVYAPVSEERKREAFKKFHVI
ncbi:site-specific tyrosine recombinase/integron integrase [Ureibacillus sp. FSL K6-2830]|uniref:site-specific tyrosine recombinase/integron integrase n=1 Tax=Ureibacillus sp. FSL K6-2830 TaxID=2954610 RepID=UPI0030F6E826